MMICARPPNITFQRRAKFLMGILYLVRSTLLIKFQWFFCNAQIRSDTDLRHFICLHACTKVASRRSKWNFISNSEASSRNFCLAICQFILLNVCFPDLYLEIEYDFGTSNSVDFHDRDKWFSFVWMTVMMMLLAWMIFKTATQKENGECEVVLAM